MPAIRTLKETILHKEITHKLGRKETGGTSRGKGAVGSTLPEGEGMGGAACHPRTAPSFTCVLAQDLSLISASWHTTHTVKPKITLCGFPRHQGLPEFGKNTPFLYPDPRISHLTYTPSIQLHSWLSLPQAQMSYEESNFS